MKYIHIHFIAETSISNGNKMMMIIQIQLYKLYYDPLYLKPHSVTLS